MISRQDWAHLLIYLVLGSIAALGYEGWVRGHREYISCLFYWLRKWRGLE